MEAQKTYPSFNKSLKWLGILDYRSIIFVFVYFFIIFFLLRFFLQNILIAIYISAILTIPVCVMIYSHINQEDVFLVMKIIVRYIFSKKIYIFDLRKSGINIDI